MTMNRTAKPRRKFSRWGCAFGLVCLSSVLFSEFGVTATPPKISLIERWSVNGTNGVLIHFDTDANRTYTLESTDKLGTNAQWKGIFTISEAVPGHFVIPDLRPGNHFYRLHVTP
jgi:hypothetical protein